MESHRACRSSLAAVATAFYLCAGIAAADPPGGIVTGGGPPPVPSQVTDFTGLWREGAAATQLFVATDLESLLDQADDLAFSGWRLEAFESWLDGGGRHYAGVFRLGTGTRVLVTGLSAGRFESARLVQESEGRRLVDVEVELVGGVRVYSGLFKGPMAVTELVRDNFDAAALETEIASLTLYRLTTFDTWLEDGEMRAYAVFHAGAGAQQVVLGLPWDDFEDEAYYLSTIADYELVDIEITEVPEDVDLFSGRFVPQLRTRDWLSICLPEQSNLITNDWLFEQGYEFSSVGLPSPPLVGMPTDDPMGMIDLEIGRDWISGGPGPSLLRPLHDSGTPGPPC